MHTYAVQRWTSKKGLRLQWPERQTSQTAEISTVESLILQLTAQPAAGFLPAE